MFKTSTSNIWTYWENLPGKARPPHIDLCHRSQIANCGAKAMLHILGPEDLPSLELDLHPKWSLLQEPAHRADYLRVAILAKFGGFWIDADTIILRSFSIPIELLNSHDMVGWEYRSGTAPDLVTFRLPIGAFGVKPNLPIMQTWLEEMHEILDTQSDIARHNWHSLGRQVLNPLLREAVNNSDMTYYGIHAESTTIPIEAGNAWKYFERTPLGDVISESELQTHISYFNSWMGRIQRFSTERLLLGDELICRIFQYALQTERRIELLAMGNAPLKMTRFSISCTYQNYWHMIKRRVALRTRTRKWISG